MSYPKEYRGSSFVGLLKERHPELVPRWDASDSGGRVDLVHGTTICAIEYAGGEILRLPVYKVDLITKEVDEDGEGRDTSRELTPLRLLKPEQVGELTGTS